MSMSVVNQIVIGHGNNLLVNLQVFNSAGSPYNVTNCSGSLYVGNASTLVSNPLIVISGSVLSGSTGWMQFPIVPANTANFTAFFGDNFPTLSYEIRIVDYTYNPAAVYTVVRGQFVIQV